MTEIQPFDPLAATPAEWAAYHQYRRLRAAEDNPGEPVLSDAEFEHDARRVSPLYESRRLFALREGEIIGNLGLSFRRPGTPDAESFAPYLYAWGGVRQRWRRQGVGRALLAALLAFMRARGKSVATMGTHVPEGHAFLRAVGAVEKQKSVENRLAFDALDWDELDRWRQAATPPGDGLAWEIHAGRVPLPRLTELLPEMTALFQDVPLGSLDTPPLRFEIEPYVTHYQELERRGGAHLLVLLLAGATLAGVCEAYWDARFPDRLHQELTAVARPWRGRGVAKGLKAAMLRLVRDRHPHVKLVITGNAEVNAPMLAINRRLGFAIYLQDSTYQLNLAPLAPVLPGSAGGPG